MTKYIQSPAYRWFVVFVLVLVFILSYFDRYLLSLVVDPLKHDLGLSDFQIGLLLGPAFSAFHVLVAIPLGLLADRTSRKWLLIAGIFIWCSMTTMSAFVAAFLPLLLLRLGLGLGEAVVSPCSVSIISDYFSRKERVRAISLYMSGPYLGAGLAFLVGGALVSWLHAHGHVTIPGLGTFAPWQMTFLLIGTPGLLFILLMLTVKEPARTELLGAGDQGASTGSAIKFLLARWKGFGVVILGSTCNFAMSTLTLWTVPLFQRVWGWSVLEIGTVTGLFYCTAGPLGTALAIWAGKALGRGNELGAFRVLMLGLLITIPASALYPVMPTAELAVAVMFLAFVGKSAATAGGPAALQLITPGEMRTRSTAIFNTFITLVGPLFGPPIIGALTDWSGDPRKIGIVLCGFVVSIGLPSLIVMAFGQKHYVRLVEEMAKAVGRAPEPAPAPDEAATGPREGMAAV
jgi:MFS family permease